MMMMMMMMIDPVGEEGVREEVIAQGKNNDDTISIRRIRHSDVQDFANVANSEKVDVMI